MVNDSQWHMGMRNGLIKPKLSQSFPRQHVPHTVNSRYLEHLRGPESNSRY